MQLTLRGERDYVQAASIFDSILTIRNLDEGKIKNIDFSMRRFTNKQCSLITKYKSEIDERKIIGDYQDASGKIKIIELKEEIKVRFPYQEYEITDQCSIHEKTISIPDIVAEYTFIEKLIAAYKVLLQTLFGSSGNFFFFIRLTLDYIPIGSFDITYDRIISNKYYQGTITKQGGNKIGSIFFGVKKS